MGLKDRLRELSQDMMAMILEPERFQGLVQHLQQSGIDATIEWMPSPADSRSLKGSYQICQGRLRISDCPINFIELYRTEQGTRTQVNQRVRQRVYYYYHYIVDTGGRQPLMTARAKRVPQRRYWLVGPVLRYRWKGEALGQALEADQTLTQRLDEGGIGRLRISHDHSKAWIRILQRFVGMTTDTNISVGRLVTGRAYTNVDVRKEYPSRQAFDAVAYLAERLRHHLDISLR